MTVGELKELISETFGIKKGKQLKKDLRVPRETKVSVYLKAGVGYIRQNNPQFHHFPHCTQAVNIYRSLSLI